MEIRKAVREDAAAIGALIHELLPYMTLAPDGAGAEQFIMSMSQGAVERYIIDNEYQYWTGWLDDGSGAGSGSGSGHALAGVVALRKGTHLFHLFVARRLHGRGLARQLWQCARGAACGAGITVNSSLHALPMYEHFGFRVTGPRVEQHGIAYVPLAYQPT